MSVAMHWGLIGLAVGATSYAGLCWLAARAEREKKSDDYEKVANSLRILGYANLVGIPVLMFLFGLQAGK